MAGKRISDKKRQKIIADYATIGSKEKVAKANGVSEYAVRKILSECDPELKRVVKDKQAQNTKDVLVYMDSQKDIVCQIIGTGLDVLNSREKLDKASAVQIATALGILIDKFSTVTIDPGTPESEDALSRSLKELGESLVSEEVGK